MAENTQAPAVAPVPNGQLISVGELAARNVVASIPELQKIDGIVEKLEAAMKDEVGMVATHMSLVIGDLQEQTKAELIKIRVGFRWVQAYPKTAIGIVGGLLLAGALIGHAL